MSPLLGGVNAQCVTVCHAEVSTPLTREFMHVVDSENFAISATAEQQSRRRITTEGWRYILGYEEYVKSGPRAMDGVAFTATVLIRRRDERTPRWVIVQFALLGEMMGSELTVSPCGAKWHPVFALSRRKLTHILNWNAFKWETLPTLNVKIVMKISNTVDHAAMRWWRGNRNSRLYTQNKQTKWFVNIIQQQYEIS